jgi:hypothetical protein
LNGGVFLWGTGNMDIKIIKFNIFKANLMMCRKMKRNLVKKGLQQYLV